MRHICVKLRKFGLIVSLALAPLLVAVPSASGAPFSPGRFVVRARPLFVHGGTSVSVFAKPASVTVDGCRSSAQRVRAGRTPVAVQARLTCRGTVGKAQLAATIAGGTMRGHLVLGKHTRAFVARLVAPPGVVLRGRARSNALAAVRDTNRVVRHPATEVSLSSHSKVLRTELVVEIAPGATVAQVDRALRAVGGRIEAAIKGSPALIVSLPDPGSVAALDALRRVLARMPGIRRVDRSTMPTPDSLPPQFATPPSELEANASAHLLAMRMPAAWNASAAIKEPDRPLVLVADFFGNGPLDGHAAVDPFSATSLAVGQPVFHGYHVTGIIAGNFADDFSAAGLVTGVFPQSSRFQPLDATGDSLPDIVEPLLQTLGVEPGHVVVNTSLGQNGGGLQPDAARILGSIVAGSVRRAGLEGRVFQATSAGNDGISAHNNSPWAAAALRGDLLDLATSHPIAPLRNTIVVENNDQSGPPDYKPTCRWDGLIEPSNFGGNVSADGVNVYSNLLGSAAGSASGTSMSSPQVAGLAEYLWSIAPDLSAPQLVSAIERTAVPATGCGGPGAPHVDAYAATLSLDQPGCFTATCAPVRFSILDQNGDGRFDHLDLQAFADHIFANAPPSDRDWSRYDLNGDGFTGGDSTSPFDLDTTGSARAGASNLGTATQTVHDLAGNPVAAQFDENKVTDGDVLCYYAYSSFYSPAPANDQRDEILGNRCAPIEILSCSTSTDYEADAAVGSDPTGVHRNTTFDQSPQHCSPPISASPPDLTASDSGTCNVPQKMSCSASASAHASMLATGSVNRQGGTIRASFTGNANASTNTGGSSHADIDGNAAIRFQVNKACAFSVSGTASSSLRPGGSATSAMSLAEDGQGTILQVPNNSSNATSGTLQPGTYSLDTSGVGDAAAPFGDIATSSGDVSASGFLTLTC